MLCVQKLNIEYCNFEAETELKMQCVQIHKINCCSCEAENEFDMQCVQKKLKKHSEHVQNMPHIIPETCPRHVRNMPRTNHYNRIRTVQLTTTATPQQQIQHTP